MSRNTPLAIAWCALTDDQVIALKGNPRVSILLRADYTTEDGYFRWTAIDGWVIVDRLDTEVFGGLKIQMVDYSFWLTDVPEGCDWAATIDDTTDGVQSLSGVPGHSESSWLLAVPGRDDDPIAMLCDYAIQLSPHPLRIDDGLGSLDKALRIVNRGIEVLRARILPPT
jgi:hypothetical protein